MKIELASVFVDDTNKALKFYTEVLGFVKKVHIPEVNWVTVTSSDEPEGTQLLLEPNDNPVSETYQKGIFAQGIPATSFAVEDVEKEYERLVKLGVEFTIKPTKSVGAIIAVFNDTCGNLIQIHQVLVD
ncbi:VOC family protein [Clostridium aciditolerans]|uniref:VOC family protein n=1 Tax=Clostridium aciditolerans TaxID=339861 RepID=A0A934M6R5_9CLOT|nr:VOC family protein [Clostridium aciditolerans]MBI6873286.1 VOC family protein [Clostridium aciditolerans]